MYIYIDMSLHESALQEKKTFANTPCSSSMLVAGMSW